MNKKSKMFEFISKQWNPLAGECQHKCVYCWATRLKKMYPNLKAKYSGEPRIIEKEFARYSSFTEDDFVFVCDMTDLFGEWVPTELIQRIFEAIKVSPAKFLLLTKNPKRYHDLIAIGVHIPLNCVLGATIESNIYYFSGAPTPEERLNAMADLSEMGYPTMISIEPIMRFDLEFPQRIINIKPKFVAVGIDNYGHGLMEPSLDAILHLIMLLESAKIKVYKKTLSRDECKNE